MPGQFANDARLGELEERLGVRFKDRSLLRLALTHSSYLNEDPSVAIESNERLEFLGDAILGAGIGHRLYHHAPEAPEGDLTAVRSHVIRERALAAAAGRLGLGGFLTLGRGEAANGGREKPSIVADAFEAVVGAVMEDQGYEAASEFVVRCLEPELTAAMGAGSPKDPKSLLQERVQADGAAPPAYRVLREDEQDEDGRFTVEVLIAGTPVAIGVGRRKLDAERIAAGKALDLPVLPGLLDSADADK
ncbi:MAG: ribonuclease III [Dehalococcoidia bacterium]|nr:ribonuclease III [Dehalococcoidia bacterium]